MGTSLVHVGGHNQLPAGRHNASLWCSCIIPLSRGTPHDHHLPCCSSRRCQVYDQGAIRHHLYPRPHSRVSSRPPLRALPTRLASLAGQAIHKDGCGNVHGGYQKVGEDSFRARAQRCAYVSNAGNFRQLCIPAGGSNRVVLPAVPAVRLVCVAR